MVNTNIKVLDYISDINEDIWIVKRSDKVIANKVFELNENGDRYNNFNGKMYKKVVVKEESSIREIPDEFISRVYEPNRCFIETYRNLDGDWRKFADLLIEIGISKNNIGIIGSYLVGFNVIKDVDFVVYGNESLEKVKSGIEYIKRKLECTSITDEHIEYQFDKYGLHYCPDNDFKDILRHNWVGIQFGKGILSTLRFVSNKRYEITSEGIDREFRGIVVEDIETNFMPRVGKIKTGNDIVSVMTNFWMFNAFLKVGDEVQIFGRYDDYNEMIYLDNYSKHYIKYIKYKS